VSETRTITLSPDIVAELEPLAAENHISLEAAVNIAIAEYLRQREHRPTDGQLAQQYDELAEIWRELAADMAGEQWLAVENEALSHFEEALDT
jgi:predicted transcriptional regulator